jgi:hypothetical protein
MLIYQNITNTNIQWIILNFLCSNQVESYIITLNILTSEYTVLLMSKTEGIK